MNSWLVRFWPCVQFCFSWHCLLSDLKLWKYMTFKKLFQNWSVRAPKCQMSLWIPLILRQRDVWALLVQVEVQVRCHYVSFITLVRSSLQVLNLPCCPSSPEPCYIIKALYLIRSIKWKVTESITSESAHHAEKSLCQCNSLPLHLLHLFMIVWAAFCFYCHQNNFIYLIHCWVVKSIIRYNECCVMKWSCRFLMLL